MLQIIALFQVFDWINIAVGMALGALGLVLILVVVGYVCSERG